MFILVTRPAQLIVMMPQNTAAEFSKNKTGNQAALRLLTGCTAYGFQVNQIELICLEATAVAQRLFAGSQMIR